MFIQINIGLELTRTTNCIVLFVFATTRTGLFARSLEENDYNDDIAFDVRPVMPHRIESKATCAPPQNSKQHRSLFYDGLATSNMSSSVIQRVVLAHPLAFSAYLEICR